VGIEIVEELLGGVIVEQSARESDQRYRQLAPRADPFLPAHRAVADHLFLHPGEHRSQPGFEEATLRCGVDDPSRRVDLLSVLPEVIEDEEVLEVGGSEEPIQVGCDYAIATRLAQIREYLLELSVIPDVGAGLDHLDGPEEIGSEPSADSFDIVPLA